MGQHDGDGLVYGEPIDDLVPAIESFYDFLVTRFRGDLREFDLPALRSELAPPFRRALLRAQAQVLLEHADALRDDGNSAVDDKDPEFEAFRRIADRVGKALQRAERREHPAGGLRTSDRHLVLVK